MQSISTTLDGSEQETFTCIDQDEIDGLFQPIMPVSIQKKKRETNREDALEWKKRGLEDLEIANLAFSGVANIWMIVKRAPSLNLSHVLALRIVASEHRKNVHRLLEVDPLDTLLSWLARPLAGVDREIVVHTLGILAQIAAHVESQRVALQVNILSQLNFILDYCRSSSRSASLGSPEVLQHCMMVISAVAEDAPGQHALCVMGYVPKLLDLMDMGYGPQVDMEIFFVLEAVSQGASGLKEVLSNDCIPRVLRRMLRPLSSLDQDLYTYNDLVLGLGCRLLANVAGSTEGGKQLLNNRTINNMKDVILQAPDDVTVVSDAILVTQRLSECKKEEYIQQMHAAKMLSTCLDAMEYHDHVLPIQQNVIAIISHTISIFRKNIVAYGGHVLVTHVLMNYPFTKELRRAAIELLNVLVEEGDGGEVFTALERFMGAMEAWLDDPGSSTNDVVRHFGTFHLKLKESVLGVANAPKADSLFSSLTSRWGSRRAPPKPWVHPRRPRPEEQLANLPVEEGSLTPLIGSHFMSLDSSAPSAAVYQEWQDEYMRTSQNQNAPEADKQMPESSTNLGLLSNAHSQVRAPTVAKPTPPLPPPNVHLNSAELSAAKSESSSSSPPTTRTSPPDANRSVEAAHASPRIARMAPPAEDSAPRYVEPPMYRAWTVDMVCGWLNSEGLGRYEPNFRAQQVAGDVLDDVNDKTLQDQLQVTVWGDRRRILAALGELKRSSNAAAAMRVAKNFDTTRSPALAGPSAIPMISGPPTSAVNFRGTSTSPLLNDLPKRRLNPLQPDAAEPGTTHLLEARASYLARMHRRADREKERREKEQTLDGTLTAKALQEKLDEVEEEQRRKAHEESQRQQQRRALELAKEREVVARAAYVKRVQDSKPLPAPDSQMGGDGGRGTLTDGTVSATVPLQPPQCSPSAAMARFQLSHRVEARLRLDAEAAALDIQRAWKGHHVRQWVDDRKRQVAAERMQLDLLWQCENTEAEARCTVDEWEADEHTTIVSAMHVSLQALQHLSATLHEVRTALGVPSRPGSQPAIAATTAAAIACRFEADGLPTHQQASSATAKAHNEAAASTESAPHCAMRNLVFLSRIVAWETSPFPGISMLLDSVPAAAVGDLQVADLPGGLLHFCLTVGIQRGAQLPCLQLASNLAGQQPPSKNKGLPSTVTGYLQPHPCALITCPVRRIARDPVVPLNQTAVVQKLAKATEAPMDTTGSQTKAQSRVPLFGRRMRTPWEEFMEEHRALMAALQDAEQIERLHVEDAQWRAWHWVVDAEQAHRQDRLELLFAEIDARSAVKVEEDAQWAALLARHDAVQQRAQRVLQQLLEEEARQERDKAMREEEEAQLRRDTEARLRKQGRAQRDLLLRDWFCDAATQLQEEEGQRSTRLHEEETAAWQALTSSLRDGMLKLQREDAARDQAELAVAAELRRRAQLQAELSAPHATSAPPAPAALPVAPPSKELPTEDAMAALHKSIAEIAAPTTPKPLPPVQKRPEWESISDAAGWKALFQTMTIPELSTLACGRLVDGYLKTSRRPPKFLMWASQLLDTVVVDVSDAGLADTHVAPLLVLLQHSKAVQCLHLDNNALTDQSAFLVAELLLQCKSLYRITVSWNVISNAGALRLLEALKQSPQVSCLDLDGNNVSHIHLQRARQVISGSSSAGLRSPTLRALSHSYPAPSSGKPDLRGIVRGGGGAHAHSPRARMQWEREAPLPGLPSLGLDKQQRRGRASPHIAAPLPSLSVLTKPPVL